MKAQNREEFESAWKAEINTMSLLYWSLPEDKKADFADILRQLKCYIVIASENCYGEGKTE